MPTIVANPLIARSIANAGPVTAPITTGPVHFSLIIHREKSLSLRDQVAQLRADARGEPQVLVPGRTYEIQITPTRRPSSRDGLDEAPSAGDRFELIYDGSQNAVRIVDPGYTLPNGSTEWLTRSFELEISADCPNETAKLSLLHISARTNRPSLG